MNNRTADEGANIVELLRHLKGELCGRYPIRDLALFGSQSRGDATPSSDVDILVDVDPSIGLGFVDLAEELELRLGRRVDLVSTRALKPAMLERIQADLIHA